MRLRTLVAILMCLLVALFVAVNWSAFIAPTTLNLLVASVALHRVARCGPWRGQASGGAAGGEPFSRPEGSSRSVEFDRGCSCGDRRSPETRRGLIPRLPMLPRQEEAWLGAGARLG